MKSLRLHGSVLVLLCVCFALVPHTASAQTKVNCAPSTPCVFGTGPYNTGTGNVAADAFGIINADFALLPSQLFAGTALPVNKGGTGVLTVTGPLKGNGTGAISAALAADIYGLWSGSCSSSTFLRGDGSCQTPAGGGNVSNSGTPTTHQTGVWTSATTIEGIGPGTTGQAFVSAGGSADPLFSASLSGVTSVNGSTVPASTTLAGLSVAETWTALQTITNSDIALLGSSTGATTFTSANASASNFTITFPAITDTLATLTATQTLTNKSIAASEVNSGTLAAAQMPALTGDVTSSAGSVATTVGKINGTSLAGLATGLLKNTTGTGVPSIATSADVIADWSGTCSSSTFLRGDGSCQTPAGGGSVTTTGTPASGNLAAFSGSTSITNGNLSGDVTTSGTLAATVVKVNGAAVPASAAVLASNSSSQLTALTLGTNLAISSGVLGTTQAINAQTGTSYAMLSTDAGKLVTFSNASAIAVTLSQATTAGFTAGYSFDVENLGAGTVTITPATSTINGSATLVITQNEGCTVTSDSTNYQVSACTAVFPGGGSGTITSSTSGQIPVYTAATTVAGSANATLTAGALTLGVSGTAGSVKMGNATSGTVQLQPVTGALGAVTASLPANTGTLAELNLAQTWTAAQTFTNSDLLLLGSSTGATTFTSANAGASNFTITMPAATDTVALLAATQTLTNKSIAATEVNSGTLAAAQMPALTGDVTSSSGTVATTVVKVNGAAVPVSALSLASNGSGQLVAATVTVNAQTGTTYTVASTDSHALVTFSNASAVAVTLPQATGSFAAGFYFAAFNKGAGLVTITPTTSTINGAATLTIPTNSGCSIVSDGTNYQLAACTASLATFQNLVTGNAGLTVTGGAVNLNASSNNAVNIGTGSTTSNVTIGNSANQVLTGGLLKLPAGTTTVEPLLLQSGTNLTTPAAGAVEYDGTVPYFTPSASSRQVLLTDAFEILSSAYTLTSQTAAQKLLNGTSTGTITLPVGTFDFECQFSLTSISATSGTFGFALGGTATFTQAWWATAVMPTTSLATPTAPSMTYNTAANTTLTAASTGTFGSATISGTVRVTVAGTIIPEVSLTVAAAAVVGNNSFCRFKPIGAQAVVSVGNWN